MSIGGADLSIQGRIQIDLVARGMDAAASSLKAVQVQAEAAGKSLRTAGQSFAAVGQKAKGIGQSLSVGVTAPLVGLAGVAINAASDLNESMSAVNTVFGKSADAVVKFSETSAQALGLSQQQTLQAATKFGALFEATGSTADQAAKFSTSLIGASADLASFYNVAGGANQVSEQFAAALTGEGDALKQYGIIINDASVKQELVRTGQDKLTGSQLEAAKVSARYNLILKNMGAAQGDFARTSDGLANKTRIARAELTNTAAELGSVLLPLVLRAVTFFARLMHQFEQLPPRTKTMILGFLAIAAAVGPVLVVLGTVASAIGALAPVFGLLLGPIGLIILALVGLGIAYKTNFLGFGDAVRAVGKVLGVFVNYIKAVNADGDILNDWLSHLPGPLQAVAKLFGRLLNAFTKIGAGFKDMIADLFAGDFSGAFQQFRKVLAGLGDALSAPAKFIGEFLKNLQTGFAPLDKLIHGIGGLWISFGRIMQEVFQGDFKGALAVGERFLRQFQAVALEAFHLLWIGIVAAFNALRGVDWSPIIAGIVAAFSRAFDWLKGSGVQLIGGLLAGAIAKLPDLLTFLGDLGKTILPYLGDAARWLYNAGRDVLSGLWTGIASLLGWFGLQLHTLPNTIISVFGQFAPWFYDIGRNIVSGIWTGISSLGGWLYEQVKNFILSNVMAPVHFILRDGSPSKTMMEIGRGISQGMALGMQDAMPAVATATQHLTTTVVRVAPPPPRLAPSTGGARVLHFSPTFNVTSSGDGKALADQVYRELDTAFGRLDLEVRR